MTQIRPATEDDRAAIVALQLRSWQSAYGIVLPQNYMHDGRMESDLSGKWAKRTFDKPLITLVSQDLSGFVCVDCTRNPPLIDNLHVDPDRRSNGIGAALMRAAFAALRVEGIDATYLTVLTGNTRAITFYESLGGQRSGPIQEDLFGHPVTAYRMDFDLLQRDGPVSRPD